MKKRFEPAQVMWIVCLLFLSVAGRAQTTMKGFSATAQARQEGIERRFDSLLSAKDQDAWMKYMTARPHHVGSPQGKLNVEYMAGLFRQWGYQVRIDSYDVLFPTPRVRMLELQGPSPYKAKLVEPALKEDATSGQKAEQLPSYNAYSADGDVTAELIFVNRGVPADYDLLASMGIDVKGKIVIAKYGGSWRGIKPKVAAERGAVGCLIYSDPADDGYAEGDVYPNGPYRPAGGVQRGSVMDMPVFPGDPLTPGYPSRKDARRLERKDAPTIMKIPVLPISYEDALPLLRSLEGPVVPNSWRGGLPITYHAGPGKSKVRLKLEFNWSLQPLYNVIATLPGSGYPDEWVMRGNHHDAWVNGAADPVSGLVAMMDEAKAMGTLAASGQPPLRTLVYCAWDGEEPALLGSTEWVEDHEAELRKKVVTYINTDGNSRGFLSAGGSHTLERFFNEVSASVTDPQTKVSVQERLYANKVTQAGAQEQGALFDQRGFRLDALGSGSDYSPFFQHLGIPSLNIGFGGEGEGGEYHSIYDSYDLFTRFKDPGFRYGVALASVAGKATLRLANAEVLPFGFRTFYNTVKGYTQEVKTLLDRTRTETDNRNRMLKEKLYELANDPLKPRLPPPALEPVPYLDFSRLDNAMEALGKASDSFDLSYKKSLTLTAADKQALNQVLYQAEQQLLDPEGLPRRPWYRHQVYAPGLYTGYGVKTLPGVREAIEQRNYAEAQDRITRLARALDNYSTQIRKAGALLH